MSSEVASKSKISLIAPSSLYSIHSRLKSFMAKHSFLAPSIITDSRPDTVRVREVVLRGAPPPSFDYRVK